MNLRTYDFECDCGVHERTVEYGHRDTQNCAECQNPCERLMCAPAIHTLESHMRGFKGEPTQGDGQGYWNPGFGEFVDENLTDPKTGKPEVYSTLKQKRELLKKHGKYEKGDISRSKATVAHRNRRSERPMIFTAEGSKRDQLG